MNIQEIPIEKIKVMENVRIRTHEAKIDELMSDIKQKGLLQPICVKKNGKEFIIQYGNRRLLACQKLGWTTIPAIVNEESAIIDLKQFINLNLSENLHRENITAYEEGRMYDILHEQEGLSVSEIAVLVNQARSRIDQCLKLYKTAPEEIRDLIKMGDNKQRRSGSAGIPMQIANYILGKRMSKKLIELVFQVVKKKELTLQQVNVLCSFINSGMTIKEAEEKLDDYMVKHIHFVISKQEMLKLREQGIQNFSDYTLKLIRTTPEGKKLFYDLKTSK